MFMNVWHSGVPNPTESATSVDLFKILNESFVLHNGNIIWTSYLSFLSTCTNIETGRIMKQIEQNSIFMILATDVVKFKDFLSTTVQFNYLV